VQAVPQGGSVIREFGAGPVRLHLGHWFVGIHAWRFVAVVGFPPEA
jgi:hypothetical protein